MQLVDLSTKFLDSGSQPPLRSSQNLHNIGVGVNAGNLLSNFFSRSPLKFVGGNFTRSLQKCKSHFTQNLCQAATPSSNLLREVNVIFMATIASLLGACLFCAVWAILASMWVNLTSRCLCVVRSSLIALRYGSLDQYD